MSGKNTVVKEVAIKQIFPDLKNVTSSTATYAQGDHMIFDATNHVVRAPTAETEASTYLGIASLDISNGKPLSPYSTSNDAAQAVPSMNGPIYGMTARMVLKTSDSINPGDQVYVYLTAGSRGVAATGTKPIGVYQGAAIATAAAGTEIEVLLGARYPNDTLSF